MARPGVYICPLTTLNSDLSSDVSSAETEAVRAKMAESQLVRRMTMI